MKTNENSFTSNLIVGIAAALLIVVVLAFSQRGRAGALPSDAVRPFKIHVPESTLTDLHKRIQAVRWPDKETVTDRTQGVQLAQIQDLVNYWEPITTGARRKPN